jgi:hypothetical protein
MNKPPLSLYYPAYVVEYANVDSTVKFIDRRTLNVGGEWLGAVPKLAICRNIETFEFELSHCSGDWESLCSVQTAATIEAIKEVAEKHYRGIGAKWVETHYKESDAIALFESAKEAEKCSFCGKSHYDTDIHNMIVGEKARICDSCVRAFYQELENGDS